MVAENGKENSMTLGGRIKGKILACGKACWGFGCKKKCPMPRGHAGKHDCGGHAG
jgi:hypothetical protein